jgi:benzaldehyde dehydrogenase (NAD)
MATGRHLVHESIYDDYVEALTSKARKLHVGDPYREEVDLGPIINEQQLERVDSIVKRALSAGGLEQSVQHGRDCERHLPYAYGDRC